MVAELVKHITAVRHDAPLYHRRDATGHEIDVLIDAGDQPTCQPPSTVIDCPVT